MSSSDSLSARVVELESMLTHLQYDFEKLSDVLIDQQAQIERLLKVVDRLENRVMSPTDEDMTRDLNDERPPHY